MAVKLSGYVYDEKGVAKNGVTVKAYNIDTGSLVATDTSDVNGLWAFDSDVVGHQADLADATYRIEAIDGSRVAVLRGDAQVQYKNINLAASMTIGSGQLWDFGVGKLEVPNGTVFPSSPTEGQVFWNTSENRLYVYDGAAWVGLDIQAMIFAAGASY